MVCVTGLDVESHEGAHITARTGKVFDHMIEYFFVLCGELRWKSSFLKPRESITRTPEGTIMKCKIERNTSPQGIRAFSAEYV